MNKRADNQPAAHVESDDQTQSKLSPKKAVIIYIATLFVVVIFFIGLSYFITERSNSRIDTLHEKNLTAQQNIENLQNENRQLNSDNDAYQAQMADMEQALAELKTELDETRRNWREDVQAVIDNAQTRYNALLAQYNALKAEYEIKVDSND